MFQHLQHRNITLTSGWKLKGNICTYNWKTVAFVRYLENQQRRAFHRVKPPASCLHGSVHINFISSLAVDCYKCLQRSTSLVCCQQFCDVFWKRFSSLCCSYYLCLIIPPTAPVMQTFSRRVSHTLLTDKELSPLFSFHPVSSVLCAALL